MAERWEDWFEPDENLLWEGAPARGFHAPLRNAVMTIIALPFLLGGFAAFGSGLSMIFSWTGIGSLIAGLGLTAFSCVFLLVGGGMFAGPWVHDSQKHERIRYALSDRAGYIATRWWKRRMNVIPLTPNTPVEFDRGRGATGSVWFRFDRVVDAEGDVSTKKQGFEAIYDAEAVHRLVHEASSRLNKSEI